jgi:Coenzyme PQQ synthesis protein D (PqqD)
MNPIARPDVLTQQLADGSTVLFDPQTSIAHELNATGALIWEYCDGTHSIGDIAALLRECFDTPTVECQKDVIQFVETLQQRALLNAVV